MKNVALTDFQQATKNDKISNLRTIRRRHTSTQLPAQITPVPLLLPFFKVVATPLERLIPFRKLQGAASLFNRRSQARHQGRKRPIETPLTLPSISNNKLNAPAQKKQGSRKKMKSDRFSIPFVIQCICQSNEVAKIDNY
jgi:hypothetical protein